VTSLAIRADYRLSDAWLVRLAILDGVPGDPERPRRTRIKLGGGDGALIVSELEYTDTRTKAAIGYWRYTARFDDVLATRAAGRPVTRGGNQGAYLLVERRLTGENPDEPGPSGWLRAGVAEDAFNPFEAYVGGGLVYTGPLPGRGEDRLGLAVGMVELGRPYRTALALNGQASDEREINIELTYRAPLAPWLTVQPDVQFVINPGARPELENALVAGLRVEVGF